ncbi:proto-oncogene tyrosine-protein kinase receptor Ret isoform X2 [Neodiprion virginianus]|uniref:proto-oncogene tyrosine-protein kinase receptor Ret isoform X2 n=1 Tax=Neodiprion virginianus TaxID=2961670 RepID=UPI001EE6D382|nr:proto-oncogene tyrosine-protein kinase receptor Ret isoform X2 [Neodiprion virginianus]
MAMDTRTVRLLLLLTTCAAVSALYFPQSDLSLRLPYLAKGGGKLIGNVSLVTVRALRNDSVASTDLKYLIASSSHKSLTLNPSTGDLKLSITTDRVSEFPKVIIVQATARGRSDAELEIKLESISSEGKKLNCTPYVKDMCFWNTSKYRIYENKPATMLGRLGPEVYATICPDFHVTRYELLNGTKYFHIVNKSLQAEAALDRDTLPKPTGPGPGPHMNILVSCVVWNEKTGNQHVSNATLSIDILDEDDNPPVPQFPSFKKIHLKDFVAGDRLDENDLIIQDADTMTVNQYSVRMLGDVDNALKIDYEPYLVDHHTNPASMAIYTRLYANTTLLPRSPYKVVLQMTDESLLRGHGDKSVNITLSFYGSIRQVSSATTTVPVQHPISYPKNIRVARGSSQFSRIAAPSVSPNSAVVFTLRNSKAFNITRSGGIVYVANTTELKSAPSSITLKIEWRNRNGTVSTTSLTVHLVNGSSCNRTSVGLHSCANAETEEICKSSCGVGSGSLTSGNFTPECSWRKNEASAASMVMTSRYETCSPSLSHCPDKTCDALEELNPRICPQDCVIESDVHFAHVNKEGRGIDVGLGMCSCTDTLQCTCGPRTTQKKENGPHGGPGSNGKSKKDGKSLAGIAGPEKVPGSSCGPTCLVGVIGASLFVLIVVAGIFVTWRYRMAVKGSRRECKHDADGGVGGLSILPSDYIDRGDGLLIGLDSLTTANRTLLLPKSCPPDPKWEFPRCQLAIEQVLGEGEFGRVLRARAIDIGGWPGPTTVAVKTLKEGACASELADLLSEYQLLKEAQHPNVIRLLGACTSPGGPVYLIIEFAEFGSLRNYLRRSRHLESEGRAPCSTSLLSASPAVTREDVSIVDSICNYGVTPRDILSFAWQISKGMAYLADIKLVHRDLAARNVLLATGKVCKISDFGLTRDVYEDDAYLKRSKGRVPVKWMAPESLADHVYTSKSDVWSFGVLLWELVTLGASPYPGVDVHNLYNLLKAGYRMEKPANCSHQLYKLMVSCWHEEAGMRPSFKELTCHWERMLEDGVDYLDLNPRTVHNRAYFTSLHALDSPTSSGTDKLGYGNVNNEVMRTDVNYLTKTPAEEMTKCDKVDKLQALWQQPIASFPEEPIKPPYVNDISNRPMAQNHYESPIKLRNASVASSTDNTLKTPPNERPQSYIDMDGKKAKEGQEDLLLFNSVEKSIEKIENGIVLNGLNGLNGLQNGRAM